MTRILALDSQGTPSGWISHELAITYHAKNLVAWQLGADEGKVMFRGGFNRITGQQSSITTAPIIAIKGRPSASQRQKAPALTNDALFHRDAQICAYCGRQFKFDLLTRDHIVPRSRGGQDIWTNVVTACGPCNNDKDDMLLSECGLQLLYVPYAPNLAESLILRGRNILACQMEYLKSFLPAHSRVWEQLRIDRQRFD